MAFDWIQQELLEYPDTFTHSNLERAALTEAVARLRWVAESPISAIRANSNSDEDTNIEDDDIDIDDVAPYVADIHPWEHWQPDNIIATLSGPAERPLLQRRGSIEQTRLYEFKLTKDNTLTISTRHAEVKAVWYKLAECYKLHRRKGKDFKLTDVFCFLQADDKILTIIPPEEVTALKWCVRIVATHAVKRLEHPTFTEIKEQSEMLIRFWFEDEMYAWTFGQMFQVMTTETQTAVDLIVIQERDKKQAGPKYQVLNHMSELNVQGIFFCCEGLGYAGKILALPKEATPPLFQQAHIS
ncbi:hypothetical protein LTR06_011020 [Exophiala xenobiotica]|nr:hypothetical protein LTR06_011020 [Exophiala xenobiotica]